MEIVSLAPSNTEIIYRLGMEHKLIGTTSLCDYPLEAAEKESVGGWSAGTDLEKINKLEPDLIVASDDLQDEIVQKLEDRGFQILQLKPHTLEEVYQSIMRMGDVLCCEEKADSIVSEMRNHLSEVNLQSKRVYCEEWMDPPMVSGNWIPGLIEKCNGKYFIEEGKRSCKFDLEKLIEFDPEYIFLNICGAGEHSDISKILERDRWQNLKAVKNDDVYSIDDALLNRPSPRLVEGVKKMERLIE